MPQATTNILPSVPQTSLTKNGFMQANNPGALTNQKTIGNQIGKITPPNQFSPATYYAAHPDANPANNIVPQMTQAPTGSQSNNNTFPGLVSTLGSTSNQPTPGFNQSQATAQNAANALMYSAPQQSANVQSAQQGLQDLQNQYANAQGSIGNQPGISLQSASGESGVLNNLFSTKEAAAQQAVQNALAGNAQQQSAFTGAANAANTTAGQATGQQQAQQSGLGTAAGLLAPTVGAYGQTQYLPQNAGQDQGNSGGSLNPINNIGSIAQQVISGQLSPQQAYAMGGNVPNFQGALNAAIQQAKPGFDTAGAQGRYDANQSNVTTAGTAPTQANADIYKNSLSQLYDLQNTTANVDQFGNLLLSTMQDKNGNKINPSDLKYANQTLSQVRNQLSSVQQATFDSTFASLKSRVSGLLAQGGSEIPTQITADANKIIDGSLPFSSLSAVLSRITTEGNILTKNLQNKLNQSGGAIGAPKSGNNSNPLGI